MPSGLQEVLRQQRPAYAMGIGFVWQKYVFAKFDQRVARAGFEAFEAEFVAYPELE